MGRFHVKYVRFHLPNVSWIVEVMIRLFIVSLRLLVQQSPPPARHFGGRAAFLGLNWHHMQTPQLKRISDVNLSLKLLVSCSLVKCSPSPESGQAELSSKLLRGCSAPSL